MIKIVENKLYKEKIEPYYILRYKYMIGDANGNTSEELDISINNPYVERYVKLLNGLKPVKGTWGVVLDEERLLKILEEKQITQDDYNFLMTLMFERWGDEEILCDIPEENIYFSQEFSEGVLSYMKYSFLVFEGIHLQYVDENNRKHNTIIE